MPRKKTTEVLDPSKIQPLNLLDSLRLHVRIYYDVQQIRIKAANTIKAYTDKHKLVSEDEGKALMDWVDDRMKKMEGERKPNIMQLVQQHPMWDHWLSKIKGIGPILAGALLSTLDPKKAKSPSSFYKYCGLHLIDGKAAKRTKGVKSDWNPFLKTTCWKLGASFVRCRSGGFYQEQYRKFKAEYDAKPCPLEARGLKHEINAPGGKKVAIPCQETRHKHEMAARKTVKLFLSHLWSIWRKHEGLPTVPPYPFVEHGQVGEPGHFTAHGLGSMIEPPINGDKDDPKEETDE